MNIVTPSFRGTGLIAFAIAAAFALAYCWTKAAESDSAAIGLQVHYLGVTRADANAVREKIAQVPPSSVNMGRLNVTEMAVEFSARAPKQVGRYVPVVVFGRNRSLKVTFKDDGKLLLLEGDGRVWLFLNEAGFTADDRNRIYAALGSLP
jgi:hypothetical protein